MPHLLTFLNSVTGAFMLGTYPIRSFLLLGAALMLLAGVVVARSRMQLSARMRPALSFMAIGSLAVLFALTLAMEASVFRAHGIPQRDLAIFMTGEEITDSRLVHTHFGKVIIGASVGRMFPHTIHRSDTGAALLPYVPAPMVVLQGTLFLLALFALFGALASRVASVSGTRQKVALGLLAALSGFIVLEKSIDGGILSDGAGLALAACLGLLFAPLSYFPRALAWGAVGYGLVLGGLYLSGWYWTLTYFAHALAHTVIFFLAAVALWYAAYGAHRRTLALLSCLALGAIGSYAYFDGDGRAYLRAPLSEGAYLATYPFESAPDLPQVGQIGRLAVYDASPLSPATVGEAAHALRLPFWYRPFSQGGFCEERFVVLSPAPLTDISSASGVALDAVFAPAGTSPAGWYRYEARITHSPCLWRYLDVVRETLREAGSDTVIVYQLSTFPDGASSGYWPLGITSIK